MEAAGSVDAGIRRLSMEVVHLKLGTWQAVSCFVLHALKTGDAYGGLTFSMF